MLALYMGRVLVIVYVLACFRSELCCVSPPLSRIHLLGHTAGMPTIFRTTICLHRMIYRVRIKCSRGGLEAMIVSVLYKQGQKHVSQ